LSAASKEIFENKFGIKDPVDGATYSIDAELIMAVNTRGYLEIVSAYRLDTADGTPLALVWKQ
jgi:hypothetical protein